VIGASLMIVLGWRPQGFVPERVPRTSLAAGETS
jgi:ABC-type branched-subunit amino acid transport system permease subunit